MNILKNNKIKIVNLLLVSFLLLSFFSIFVTSDLSLNPNLLANPKLNSSGIKDTNIMAQNYNSDLKNSDQSGINDWSELIQKYDLNSNGISDQFENELSISTFSNINGDLLTSNVIFVDIKEKNDLNEKISFIIQFPNDYDYNREIKLFETNQGILKHTYKETINGFAGAIDFNGFLSFYDELKEFKNTFLIEKDSQVKAQLYYVSRNMNLRPYTWNTLGYNGDNKSSIAIIDTGIDDTHSSFPAGYGDKDFTKKIVGWVDFIGSNSTVNDLNGHGTHVAAIAAGEGSPQLDYLGRTVGTSGLNLDFSTGNIDPLPDGYALVFTVAKFNVTSPGKIEIECEFTDFTLGSDNMYGWAYLYKGNTQVDSLEYGSLSWNYNLSYTLSSSEIGEYSLEFWWIIDDGTGNGYVTYPDSRFRGVIHYPFNPPSFGCGDSWKGVAYDTHIVGVRVLDQNGGGSSSDIIKGVEWVIKNKLDYNITIMSMSLGTQDGSSEASLITAVNKAVEAGIVTVCAAGNLGYGNNKIGSPGDADKVITIAAMNYKDQITSYSSQGGSSASGYTIKPDITAPGGSTNDFTMFSADSNNGDVDGAYVVDYYTNDSYSAQGTSMATPAVAGAASLLIEAMGGRPNWHYTETEVKLVKSLLLMTATETVNWREEDTSYYPTLDRGSKDVHEGYGRLNIDAAIEAWKINNLTEIVKSSKAINVWLNTSQYNPSGKHAYGGYVNLNKGSKYQFNLSVPSGSDYDLYIYNYTPNAYGEPVIVAFSTSPVKGHNEVFNYTANYTGKFFVVVKAVGNPLSILLPEEEEDEDNTSETVIFDVIEFLTSPLGLILMGSIVAVIIIIVIVIVKTRKKEKYDIDYVTRTSLE